MARPGTAQLNDGATALPSQTTHGAPLRGPRTAFTFAVSSNYSAAYLIQLDRFEQRLEVAFAAALVALALDDLEKDGADHRLGEDLQQHLVRCGRAVDQYAIARQPRRVFLV